MNTWKDHNGIKLFHELPRPFLFVWNIAKDMVSYMLDLIAMCWKALCSAMNKNVLIPAAAAAFGILFVNYGYEFVLQIMNANNHANEAIMSGTTEKVVTMIVQLLSVLPLCWGMATMASVIKAKDEEKDDSWKQHTEVGQKAVRFFLNFIGVAGAILVGLVVLSFVGKIPQIGKPLLSLLVVPFYFASMVFWLTVVGLVVGAFFFGSFYLSGKYEESASLMSRAKALYCMAGCKIVDFLSAGLPAIGMAVLFFIIPAYLTMASIQLMEWPSKDVWSGFRFPGVIEAFHNTNEYPTDNDTNGDGEVTEDDEEPSERLLMPGNFDYPTVQKMQRKFDNAAGKDGKNVEASLDNWTKKYDKWAEQEDNEGKDQDDFAEEQNKGYDFDRLTADGESWIVSDGEWTMSLEGLSYVNPQNENDAWASSSIDGSNVYFDGESHSRMMIWLTALILVFSSSVVVAVPAGFLLAGIGATSYRLYQADYSSYAVWKRILVLATLLSSLSWVGMSCTDCMDGIDPFEIDIEERFGLDREPINKSNAAAPMPAASGGNWAPVWNEGESDGRYENAWPSEDDWDDEDYYDDWSK